MPSTQKELLIVEQRLEHAEDIYQDISQYFDHYHIALSLSEAHSFIAEHDFDMIIVNPFFPDGSGREFIAELMNNKKLYTTPLIVVSNLPEKKAKLDFYSYGADAYFEIPYDKEYFRKTIEEKLKRHIRLLIHKGNDRDMGVGSRLNFEENFKNTSQLISDNKVNGFLGLIAPAAIDFVIRDFGLEAGDRLIKTTIDLMRKMCDKDMKVAMWTQKSIVFGIVNKKETDILKGLEQIRLNYLGEMKRICKLQESPGLRAVIKPISAKKTLEEQMKQLLSHLVTISKDENAVPIQVFSDQAIKKHHVILVDNDPVSVNIISHRLRKEGFSTDSFYDLRDILNYPYKKDLSAILVDSMIPSGGIDFLREINKDPELSKIPAILLSRYGHEDEIAEAFEAGAEDYLMKPISLVELSARVKRLVTISKDENAVPIQVFSDQAIKKHHVILVDNDPVSVNIISHRLRKEGFSTDSFYDLRDILNYPYKKDLSAILVDSMIPSGGIDFLREINKDPELSKIPAILLSRYGHEDEIAEAFEAGAEDYLMKPISLVELSARVKRFAQ
jgi:DNA-binding response OmpR family regulator